MNYQDFSDTITQLQEGEDEAHARQDAELAGIFRSTIDDMMQQHPTHAARLADYQRNNGITHAHAWDDDATEDRQDAYTLGEMEEADRIQRNEFS